LVPFADYESLSSFDLAKCDRQIEEFKDTRTITCPSDISYFKIMAVLRERRRVLCANAELDAAADIDTLIHELSDFFLENKLYAAKAVRVAIAESQYEAERARLDDLTARWNRDLQTLIRQRDAALARTAEAAETNLRGFDGAAPERLPPEFTRLSADLLDLRDRERHLIVCRRFQEAARLHAEFVRRQREELVRRREEFFVHLERQRSELERRNVCKASAVNADWKRKIDKFILSMERELAPLRSGVANLLSKLTAAKAEYIGEDDPILANDPLLTRARDSGNIFRASTSTFTQSGPPRSIVATRRPIERPVTVMTTKRLSTAMYRQNFMRDGRKWL
jgi:hypothetical protein